jgi:dolichol-phosphate mannosyltransferase
MVTDELIAVVNSKWSKKMRPYHHMVSILVPALNEQRTVQTVLQDLSRLNFESLGLAREILLMDGGSTDRTVELARNVPDITVHQLTKGFGRGAALRLGIEKANGNIIVFFPSDNEYDPQELLPIVQTVATADFQVVFGSRTIKCVNMNERIMEIYKDNYFLYLSSKYGGMLISIMSLILYNRFVSDPLTGIKAFEARMLKNLALKSNGFDIETEILAKLGKKGIFILEQPVNYHPRSRAEGKKTTFGDGLRAVFRMLRVKFSA